MKRVVALLVLFAFLLSFVACSKIVVAAPKGKNIILATSEKHTTVQPDKQKMVWYVLWGLVPLGDNSTADLLEDVPNNSKVLVQSELTVVDFLISAFLGFVTIQTHTVGIKVVK